MFTQVELMSGDREYTRVYWVRHDRDTKLVAGRGIKLHEEPKFLNINRVFISLKDITDLLPKVRVGTIAELN